MNQVPQDIDDRASPTPKTSKRQRSDDTPRAVQGIVPQFAANLASEPAERVTRALSTAADSIDLLVDNDLVPLSDGLRDLVHSASEQLREVAERTGPDQVGLVAMRVQLAAARNPALAAMIGAALGAALGFALSRSGSAATSTEIGDDE